jgi:hypothetical protein
MKYIRCGKSKGLSLRRVAKLVRMSEFSHCFFVICRKAQRLGNCLCFIQEDIKRRLNSGNACYHSVQNFLSSRVPTKNLKIRTYKTILLPVVLYGCET